MDVECALRLQGVMMLVSELNVELLAAATTASVDLLLWYQRKLGVHVRRAVAKSSMLTILAHKLLKYPER
eukprot:scaffold1467_cov135-Skeletonema_marinoi.AAC.4